MKPEELEKLGLSPNESKIYLALLEIGSSTADKISQKAGIHRRTIYDNVEKLLNKGLISYVIKANKKYFEAADPHKLKDILNEKHEKIKEQDEILNNLLPELILTQKLSGNKQEVTIYKGKKGIKTILWDILRERKENRVIGAHAIEEYGGLFALFNKKRINLKIKNKMIFKKEDVLRAKKFKNLKYTETRVMPKEHASPLSINIYGDKTALLVSSNEPIGILIKNKDTSGGFKAYFEMLWNSCEKMN